MIYKWEKNFEQVLADVLLTNFFPFESYNVLYM